MSDRDAEHEDTHAHIRSDDELWNALPLVGMQWDSYASDMVIELRNCSCGSTLGRRVRRTNAEQG